MALETAISSTSNVSTNFQFLEDNKKSNEEKLLDAVTGKNSMSLFDVAHSSNNTLKEILFILKNSNHILKSMMDKMMMGGVELESQVIVDIAASGSSVDFVRAMKEIALLDDIGIITVANGLEDLANSIDILGGKSYDRLGDGLGKLGDGIGNFSDNIPKFKVLAGVAAGIGAIGVGIALFGEVVSLEDIGLVAAGGLAIGLWDRLLPDGTGMEMMKTAAGIASLGLAIWAFSEIVTAQAVLETFLGLTAIGLTLKLFDTKFGENVENVGKSLLWLAAGGAALALSSMLFNEVAWESIGKMTASLAGVALIGVALDKAKFNTNDAITVAILAGAVGILGLSLLAFNEVSLEDVGVALAALAGVGLASVILGKVGKNGLLGAIVIAAMGGALGVLSWGLGKMLDLNLTWEDAGVLAATVGLTAAAFAVIGIPVVAGLIALGAIAAAAMGVGLATLSWGLNKIKEVEVTEDDAMRFATSVGYIKDAVISIGEGGGTLDLAFGAAQAVLITGAVVPLTLAMMALNNTMMPDEQKMTDFNFAVVSLKDIFTQFGALEVAELGLVTPVILAVSAAVVGIGGAINLFTKLSTNRETVESAMGSVDGFIVGIKDTFTQFTDDEFERMRLGIRATGKLGKLLRSLAFGVSAIGAEIEKGTDFGAIGRGVGSMLTALTEPLVAIGSQQDQIEFAGFSITNPFSNKVADGIDALKDISNVFTPISDIVKVFAQENSQSVVDNFSKNLTTILSGISQSFGNLDPEAINEETVKRTGELTTHVANLMAKLGNNEDGEAAAKNFANIAKSAHELKEAVNEMDLERLSKLDSMFYNIGQLEEGELTEALVDALADLAEALKNSQNVQQNNNQSNQTNISNNQTSGNQGSNDDNDDIERILESNSDNFENVANKIEDLVTLMSSGNLRVRIKENNF